MAMSAAKWLPRLLGAILLVFGAVTVWAVTVNGFLEAPRLNVEYFNAGAGDGIFLLRLVLALGASIVSVSWAFQRGSVGSRLARLAVVPGVFLILAGSVVLLNRYAPGYSEEKFLGIVRAHQNGEAVTIADVTARLGKPLMTASRPGGYTTWSYTFTPSGGFGWPKRTVTFDSEGVLVDTLYLDEP
jgi:hypothetical protein